MRKISFLLILAAVIVSCTSNIKVEDLKCEYLTNPLGVDISKPGFSWKISSNERGVYQDEYKIVVSDNPSMNGNIWDSGFVKSGNTVNIPYNGTVLKSNTCYYWTVEIKSGSNTVKSKQAQFHTGILRESDWKAGWITTGKEIRHSSPIFRKEFSVEKQIDKAFVFATAAGFYELFLNGNKVGDHVLDPAITDFSQTVLYSTYDVTKQLKQGKNAIGAMLGNSAYNMLKVRDRYSWGEERRMGDPKLLIQLVISYKDGTEAVIATDATWKTTDGPVTFNNIYGGEDFDARKEIKGWSMAGLDESAWGNAAVVDGPGGKLQSQMMPPIKVTNTIQPIVTLHPEEGVYLFDLGQNIAGWWKVSVKGQPGQTIRIKGAETLNDSLFPKLLESGDILSKKMRYHSLAWTDYTIGSTEKETYEPHFFYSGFRYVEVTTNDKKDLPFIELNGRVVRSSLETAGSWTSSNTLLNKIHIAGLWSQMGNTVGYPTDCPHREKGAYNGDGQVIAETSMHDFDMVTFYYKWLNDMRDSQEEDGRIPNTSPPIVGGMGGGIAWGSAYVLIPWWIYNYYDDEKMLKEHYPTMKKYIDYLRNLARTDQDPSQPYIIDFFNQYWYSLGEWCSPGMKDCPNHAAINTFYYYYDVSLMAKIAQILGYQNDVQHYTALSDTIKQAYINAFYNAETGLVGTDEAYQPYQLVALLGNLIPDGEDNKVFKTIVDDIHSRDNHLNTGIIGTKYLWPTLATRGENNLAFKVATKTTYPSYGYWLENGSTTLLEEWDGRNSHNHQMFGSITEYFYKYLAGIQSPMEGKTTRGYKHIHIQPYIPDDLQMVKASLKTISGEITSEWEKGNNGYNFNITVPANTTATLVLPAKGNVSEGNSVIWENNSFKNGVSGITTASKNGEELSISLLSGNYKFIVK